MKSEYNVKIKKIDTEIKQIKEKTKLPNQRKMSVNFAKNYRNFNKSENSSMIKY